MEREQNDFNHCLQREGWKVSYWPPIVSLQDLERPKNGRKRIRSAVTNGERHIPVAFYNYPSETTVSDAKKDHITNGLKANFPTDHSDPTKFTDLFNAAKVMYEDPKIDFDPNDEQQVHDWIYQELEADSGWSDISIGRLKKKIDQLGPKSSGFMNCLLYTSPSPRD